ncbi:MAG: dihydroneopterin aldolase [Firmicutes bacterium]|nr:dihydroneopterin aldolase [Bacillota bacterium]
MGETDDLSAGLSYVTVYNLTKKVVTGEQHKLVQRIAQRIADEIIAAHPIKQVRVTVKKPSVAIGGIVDYAGCSIVREPEGMQLLGR